MIWYKKSDKKNVHDRTSTQRGNLGKELKRTLQKNYVDEKEMGERKEIGGMQKRGMEKKKKQREKEIEKEKKTLKNSEGEKPVSKRK